MTSNCSLPGDLQEPFRWIADVTVMEGFESRAVDLPDFYFTGDDYRCRFEPEAKQRFLDLLLERFNIGARYKGRVFKWDSVIEQKTTELGRYLAGKSATVDLSDPAPRLLRIDDQELRTLILSLPQSQAKRFEIGRVLFTICAKKLTILIRSVSARRLAADSCSLEIEIGSAGSQLRCKAL